jgi:hypothetical protein
MVEVPDTTVSEDCIIDVPVDNTLVIEPGVNAIARAPISGTVEVQQDSVLDARSDVSGTVHLSRGARAVFHGRANGTINIEAGAVMRLLPKATALGTLIVDGTLINEGTRGVNVSGSGTVDDREGSTVRQPNKTLSDGSMVYEG